MRNNSWTGPEQKRLVELYQRFNMEGCAMILERSVKSIDGMISELKLKSPNSHKGNTRVFYAEDVAHIFEFKLLGFSNEDIAKCYNKTAFTIRKTIEKAKREGIDRYPKRTL